MEENRNKKLVLMVDDEKDFHDIFGTALEASDITVEHARNSKEAVEKALKFKPDLILMDINLSEEKRGIDVAEEIMDNPETANLRIAFLSNIDDPFPAVAGANDDVAKELGMVGFLAKTADVNTIIARVKEMLGGPPVLPTAAPPPPPRL
jgi:CheY-like chemotaxis protein